MPNMGKHTCGVPTRSCTKGNYAHFWQSRYDILMLAQAYWLRRMSAFVKTKSLFDLHNGNV